MRRNLYWAVAPVAAAVLGVATSSAVFADEGAVRDDKTVRTDSANPGKLAFPAGINVKDLNEQSDIRNALGSIAESGVKRDGFNSLVNRLVDADRDRIGRVGSDRLTSLNTVVDKLRDQWKTRYGRDFDIDENTVYMDPFAQILQGEIADPNAVAANWPVPAAEKLRNQPLEERATPAAAREDANKLFGGDRNLDKGRNVALVHLTGHDLPGLTLSLIHEMPDTWRFDIPDNITADQLRDSLVKHLTYLTDHETHWPADVQEAYRLVTHHVAMAIYNVDMPATHEMKRTMDNAKDKILGNP